MTRAQSFFSRREWVRRFPAVSAQRIFIFMVHPYDFCFVCGEIMTQRQATGATSCACDMSALYCVEPLWKAPGIRHPSQLLEPGISRLLLIVDALLRSAQARYNNTQQQQCKDHATTSTPVAPSSSRQRHARVADKRCIRSSCFVEPEIRHPITSMMELYSTAAAATCMYYARGTNLSLNMALCL